jgi:hypothetical protein
MTHGRALETSELLRSAWEAVERSGVPESVQEAAFKEAVADIRLGGTLAVTPSGAAEQAAGKRKRRSLSSVTSGATAGDSHRAAPIDASTFFAQLSAESGVDENDLRDVLSLSGETVYVTVPTRELGSNTAEQAKTVIALVAGAYSFGLGERPVLAKAVRTELTRKNCYQGKKFAERHLGPLRGFNFGAGPTEIVTTSKWVDDFAAAVNRALGRTAGAGES